MEAVYETDIPHLDLVHKGKVRDVYAVGEERLLLVATDRISAFDRILTTPIPGKGIILANLSAFWFKKCSDWFKKHPLLPFRTHYIASMRDNRAALEKLDLTPAILKRSVLVRKAERINLECIVRGYLTGSAWRDYERTGELNGEWLPPGMKDGQQFDAPRFTPSTKAEDGEHDAPLDAAAVDSLVGVEVHRRLKSVSLELYDFARRKLQECGLLLADTKFEFGIYRGELHLIDELFTSDSSRFWDEQDWHGRTDGRMPEPLDKEYVRNWLREYHGNMDSGNELPDEVIASTLDRYKRLYTRIVGQPPPLDD